MGKKTSGRLSGFDPYHRWLGIPKDKRPPTFYELLGVSIDEEDEDVIRSAAQRQRAHVEQFKDGPHAQAASTVLYQIGEAETTLLNPQLRRDYDRQVKLFKKRRKRRQVDPSAGPSEVYSSGRAVGEGSGLVREYAGIMGVILAGFVIMVGLAFYLPWDKLGDGQSDKSAAAETAAAPKPDGQESKPSEGKNPIQPERDPKGPSEVVSDAEDSSTEQVALKKEPISLFDGSSLNGWAFTVPPSVEQKPSVEECWAVDSERRVLFSKANGQNWLQSEQRYQNFILSFDWRFTPGRSAGPNGSGVVIRSNGLNKVGFDPRGIEIDLRPNKDEAKGLGTGCFVAYDMQIENHQGRTSGEVGQKKPSRHLGWLREPTVRSNGNWNECEITCKGDRVTVTINDDLVNEGWGVPPVAGYICLRNQNSSAEFRNLALTLLDPKRPSESEPAESVAAIDDKIAPSSDQKGIPSTVGQKGDSQLPDTSAKPENEGWRFYDVFDKGITHDQAFVVARDGSLVCQGNVGGFCLTSLREYAEFTFTVDFQMPTEDVGGKPWIGVASTLPNPDGDTFRETFPFGIETKLHPDEIGQLVLPKPDFEVELPLGQLRDERKIVALRKPELKDGDWNTLEIKCDEHQNVTAEINGTTVNALAKAERTKGYIVIYPQKAEIRLRNAEVVSGETQTKLAFDEVTTEIQSSR